MEEKRKYKRLPITLHLEVSNLFNQANTSLPINHADLEVFDISKAGIGFTSTSDLPLDYYFNASISVSGNAKELKYVVKINRKISKEDGSFVYGCEFVGIASIFDYVFDDYEKLIDS